MWGDLSGGCLLGDRQTVLLVLVPDKQYSAVSLSPAPTYYQQPGTAFVRVRPSVAQNGPINLK